MIKKKVEKRSMNHLKPVWPLIWSLRLGVVRRTKLIEGKRKMLKRIMILIRRRGKLGVHKVLSQHVMEIGRKEVDVTISERRKRWLDSEWLSSSP
jgi:hypothetical protein